MQITENIKLVEVASLPRHIIRNAAEIVKDIDPEDAPFVALYLYTKHKIWTGDNQLIKGLKHKGYDICITTAELRKSLYKP